MADALPTTVADAALQRGTQTKSHAERNTPSEGPCFKHTADTIDDPKAHSNKNGTIHANLQNLLQHLMQGHGTNLTCEGPKEMHPEVIHPAGANAEQQLPQSIARSDATFAATPACAAAAENAKLLHSSEHCNSRWRTASTCSSTLKEPGRHPPTQPIDSHSGDNTAKRQHHLAASATGAGKHRRACAIRQASRSGATPGTARAARPPRKRQALRCQKGKKGRPPQSHDPEVEPHGSGGRSP